MASGSERQRSRNEYTVACICPKGLELAPVEGMLDEKHPRLPTKRGQNVYTLGKIGVHNVVVAVLPQIGDNAMARVTTQLLNDFPAIRFGLLVGVGAGVPVQADVRLGDVVVSKPNGMFGGVVQFDLERRQGGGLFIRTTAVSKLPDMLSSSVSMLESEHKRNGHQLSTHISEMLQKHPNMLDEYSFPTAESDYLFRPSYLHLNGRFCDSCDKQHIFRREQRQNREPHIHYGTIGSVNIVVKDPAIRDKAGEELKILCLEMEAAGISDVIPYLVIRGISDYADSHKNEKWQPYAAAVAAAYMKELLISIPGQTSTTTTVPVAGSAPIVHSASSVGVKNRKWPSHLDRNSPVDHMKALGFKDTTLEARERLASEWDVNLPGTPGREEWGNEFLIELRRRYPW